MPVGKDGKHYFNPAIMKHNEGKAAAGAKGQQEPGDGEHTMPEAPAHSHHTFRHEDGSYHSTTHHADGTQEETEHATHEHAVEHQKAMFHEDGGSDGKCPDCGGKMVNGSCEDCGYTAHGGSDDGGGGGNSTLEHLHNAGF